MKDAIQLTFGSYGHTLHHCQIMSPDNQWIVYDTRNADGDIGITTRIERVNIETKKVEILYEVQGANLFGPGVGAVTYSPTKERVIFIHGLNNASAGKPYSMTRRSGVAIDTQCPNQPISMDARNVISPYTKGALRGGTHSHCWNHDGSKISFTYNDAVLEKNNLPNERVVGVMFPKKVVVSENDLVENFSGEMFSVIVSKIVPQAKPTSDEIEKAFDECWLGNTNSLVFQGWVRDEFDNRKTEIFKVSLPDTLKEENFGLPLQGTKDTLPNVPKGVNQARLTFTNKGLSSFRHWLRSSPDGDKVYFLMEDENEIINIFELEVKSGIINQLTFHNNSIHSPFNLSPNGKQLVYFSNYSIYLFNLDLSVSKLLLETDLYLYGIPNFDKSGKFILFNKYVADSSGTQFLQIFKISL